MSALDVDDGVTVKWQREKWLTQLHTVLYGFSSANIMTISKRVWDQ